MSSSPIISINYECASFPIVQAERYSAVCSFLPLQSWKPVRFQSYRKSPTCRQVEYTIQTSSGDLSDSDVGFPAVESCVHHAALALPLFQLRVRRCEAKQIADAFHNQKTVIA